MGETASVEWYLDTWDIEHVVTKSVGGNNEIYNRELHRTKVHVLPAS
jgi:hypothetical protein